MRRSIGACACLLVGLAAGQRVHAQQRSAETISLDSLLQVPVTAAAKYAQHAADAAASVTIITSGDIERYGYSTLDQVLASVRSFYTSYDRNYTYVGVRGFGRPTDYDNRIVVLVNGHALNEAVYGMSAAGTDLGVNLNAIERIEIVRGPGSALYGTNAMFAVINLVTKTGASVAGMNVNAEGGSLGSRAVSFHAGTKLKDVDVLVVGQAAHTNGGDLYFSEYADVNGGSARGLDWDAYSNLMTVVSRGGLTFQAKYSSRQKGIPTGAWGVTFNDARSKTLDDWAFAEVKYDSRQHGKFAYSARSYVDYYHYQGWYAYDDVVTRDATGTWRAGGEARVLWDPTPTSRVTLGAEYRNNLRADYHVTGSDIFGYGYSTPFQTFSGYVQGAFHPLSRVTVNLGLRADASTIADAHVTPRTALLYTPFRGATVKFLYGESFRSPDIHDVSWDGAGYKKAVDLQPERMRTAEIVWEQRLNAELFGTVALYSNDLRGLIDSQLDPADSLYQYRNRAEVASRGLEFELNARIAQGLQGYASFAVQTTHDGMNGAQLTNSPQRLAKFGLSVPVGSWFDVSPEIRHESGRLTVTGTTTSPFFLANLRLATRALPHGVGASLLVRNVFDTKYFTPGGIQHLQSALEQDGRALTFRVDYRL